MLRPVKKFSFRHGEAYPRPAASRFLGNHVLPDGDLQRLAFRIATEPKSEQSVEAFSRLCQAYVSETEPALRLHAVRRAVRTFGEEVWGDPPLGKSFLPHPQLSALWDKWAIEEGRYVDDPPSFQPENPQAAQLHECSPAAESEDRSLCPSFPLSGSRR